jgi:hypothetical protein
MLTIKTCIAAAIIAATASLSAVPVRRLTFAYEGDQVRLVSEQRVNMILPPSQLADELERQTGFSVILRDEGGQPVYAHAIASPFQFDREIFDRDPARSSRRESNPHPRGTFVVLVPALENALRLELFGHPLGPKGDLEPTRRLASFLLPPLTPR